MSKFYGKKFVQIAMRREARNFIESRDAVIHSVDKVARTCMVRIQGSNTNIVAGFPQNLKTIPSWLRKGNAVTLAHRSGIRGRVYITGQGTTVPTLMAGGVPPDPEILIDTILTGCKIEVTNPNTMGVVISAGTYRINEVVYNLTIGGNYMTFGQTPEMFFGQDFEIFFGGDIIKFLDDAPAVTYFRYDAFCVGENGVIDYIKGTESQLPVKPDIPTDHLLIDNYILIIGGIATVENMNIGLQFTTPVVSVIELDIGGDGMSYEMEYDSELTGDPQYVEVNIVFSVKDQYNNPIAGSRTLNLEKVIGDGDLWSDDDGYNDTAVSQSTSGGSYTFKYRRDQLIDVDTVVFKASITGRRFEIVGIITLLAGV